MESASPLPDDDQEAQVLLIGSMSVASAYGQVLLQPRRGYRSESELLHPKPKVAGALQLLYMVSRSRSQRLRRRIEGLVGTEEADAIFSSTFRANMRDGLLALANFRSESEAQLCNNFADSEVRGVLRRDLGEFEQVVARDGQAYFAILAAIKQERAGYRAALGLPPEKERPAPTTKVPGESPARGCLLVFVLALSAALSGLLLAQS